MCKSNLRQMALILKTYAGDHDGLFPDPGYIYHSPTSFWYPRHPEQWLKAYRTCCRWHDARIGFDSPLLRHERPDLRGSLWPYIGDPKIVRCRTGVRANLERGCSNACDYCVHDPGIAVVPQYTYCMNAFLHTTVSTGSTVTGSLTDEVDSRTIRGTSIHKETQVTRSPSEVFAFGEQNSWAMNTEGRQPIGLKPPWATPYDLSGKYHLEIPPPKDKGCHGTLGSPRLSIETTYELYGDAMKRKTDLHLGHAFATCHRPRKGDPSTGHSYISMLDGHVQQVTVADQLRKSRRVPFLPESRLGPGGNLTLAWPLNVPPPGGWENQ